jgi:hypothetical protein
MLKVIFLVEGELSFAFFCPFGYIPHPLDAPSNGLSISVNHKRQRSTLYF